MPPKLVSHVENYYRLEGYRAYREDTTSPNYYQFVNPGGDYYIIKETVSGNVTTQTYYQPPVANIGVDSQIDADWSGRAGLTYGRIDSIMTRILA